MSTSAPHNVPSTRNGSAPATNLWTLSARTIGLRGEGLARVLRADQAERWRAGDRITADVYLAHVSALKRDETALFDLIRGEIELRGVHGELAPLADYLARYPALDARLRALFGEQPTLDRKPPPVAPPTVKSEAASTKPPPPPVPAVANGVTLPSKEQPVPASRPRIAHFEILEELGRGGMGVVYRARDTKLHRFVALKVVLAGPYASAEEMVRFLTEAEAAGRLTHPNIVPVYEIGRDKGRPYYTMELCPGGSLSARLRGNPLTPTDAARLIETLARAVEHAHQHGIVHRDLKPGNILISGDSDPHAILNLKSAILKIADFSLAKRLDLGVDGLTDSGAVLGTPSYMAPEQASGNSKTTGPAADIYALGAILYELISGRPPFRGATVHDTIEQVKTMEPVPPTRFDRRLPRDLETICLKCLQKDPERRYASAVELAEELRRFQAGEPIKARPISAVERGWRWAKRHPAVAALSAAVVLTFAIGSALVTWQWRQAVAAQAGEAAERVRADDRADEASRARDDEARERRRAEDILYFNRVALAEREWSANNVGRAAALLDACPPARRGWEWHHLHRLCHLDLRTFAISGVRFNDVASSADGRLLAGAGGDGNVYVFDVETGRRAGVFACPGGEVWAVAFAPEGNRLASAGADGVVRLWDVATGQRTDLAPSHRGAAADVTFSADGSVVASAGHDGVVRMWSLPRGTALDSRTYAGARATSVALSPDGRRVAVALALGRGQGEAIVTDLKVDKETRFIGHSDAVTGVAFSRDGRTLATASFDRTARLWDATTGREKAVMRGHAHGLYALAFGADDTTLVTASHDQTAALWDLTSPEMPAQVLRGHAARVTGVAFAAGKGGRVVTCAADGTLRLWDPTSASDAFTLIRPPTRLPPPPRLALRSVSTDDGDAKRRGPPGEVVALSLTPDGGRGSALVTRGDGAVVLSPFALKAEGEAGRGGVAVAAPASATAFACSAAGRWIAFLAADEAGRARLTVAGEGAQPRHFTEGVALGGKALAFDETGGRLAVAGEDGTILIWKVAEGVKLRTLRGHAAAVSAVAFGRDGKGLVSGDVKGGVQLWDVNEGKSVGAGSVASTVSAVAWSRDGRLVAAATRDRRIVVCDATSATLAPVQELIGHAEPALALSFAPDGRRLASAGEDFTVRLWDVATGHEALALRGHADLVRGVAFSADGTWLVSGGRDGAVLARRAPQRE